MKNFIINAMYDMLIAALAEKASDTESQVDDQLVAILASERTSVIDMLKRMLD